MDQIFPDKAQLVLESNSNIGEDNRKIAKLSQRLNITTSECASPNKQKKTLNLQPVLHNIEQQFSTNYNDLFNSEEARIRISRLVEKQKKAHALSQLKSSEGDRSPIAAESRRTDPRSVAGVGDLNDNRSGREKEPTESNNLKRKVVLCQKVPSYKGFSETSAAPNSSQKKEASNNSWNNSTKKILPAKEDIKTKVCEASKEPLNKNSNIQSLNEGKRLIRVHIQQSKQSSSTQQIAAKQSHPPPTQPVRSVGRLDRSPPRKYSSPTRPSKVPRIVHETDSHQEPTPKQNDKELSAQKHEVLPNQTSGALNKESCKEKKPTIRNISKTKKEQKKLSPPDLSSENEDKSRKKTYNQEEIRKYISRKKDEKKKHKHALQATAIKRREGKEQTMMLLAHHQKEAFQNAKKNPSKSKHEDEVLEKNAPSSSSWEEVFAAINSQKQSAEVKDASVGTNGVATVQVSTASSYEVSTKVSFATSYTRTTEVDVHSPPDKIKQKSSVRLQKIQESARLLSSRLDFQTTELISYFRGKESNVKSARDASIMTSENPPLPAASSTETDSISQNHLKQLHKSQKDVSQSIPSSSVAAFVASSNPTIETRDAQKHRDYFRVPDDLPKLNACLLKEAESSKSTGAVMLGKNVENLPRDMFPSENLRKKLSKKASLSNLENKTSFFDEAKTSRHRLSFGSDSTFDEFNWKLIHSFLATEESRLMYQNSMSKIKQQALEDHSKSLSNIAEPSNKTRIFSKRGMDDVYPQTMKKSRNQSLSRSHKDTSEEVSSSCEIYAESLDRSEKQMLTDDSESTRPSEIFKNVKSKKKSHELNLKLGEKMLARKEETLKQRKERLMKLLERLDSLDTTEREVNQMEIEISRRWKNFSDLQQTLDGKSGVNQLALKEIAVQTNTSSQDVFVGGDQESINVSIKHVGQADNEELVNDSIKDEESMKDVGRTKDEVAEVHKDSKVQCANNTPMEQQRKMMTKLVRGNVQNEAHQGSPDIFSPACNDSQIDKNVGFDHVTDFSLIFDQVPGFDLNIDISPETRNICQKISKDSLEVDGENVNKEIKAESTKSSDEVDDDSLKDLAIETNLKEASKTSMSSETLCISPDNLEVARRTTTRPEGALDEVVVVESLWSNNESKENLENRLRAIGRVSEPNFERIEREIQTIDSEHRVDGKEMLDKACASARVGFIERSFSCESIVSKDSLTAVISPVLHEVAEENTNGGIPDGDSINAHALDSGDSLNAIGGHVSRSKVSTVADPESIEIEDISTEKTETTESGCLMKAIESAAAAVELFSEPDSVDTEEKDTAEKQREGSHLPTENINSDPGNNDICPKNSIITNYIPDEVGDRLDWSKIKLGNFIVKSVAGDLLKDTTDAMFDAMKNKKRMLQRKDSIESEEEVKEEAGAEALSDEYIDDDNYSASVPMRKEGVEVRAVVLPEIYGIPKSKEDLTALISESLDIYWNQRRNGEPWDNLLPPICFLTKSTTVTPPESTFRTFMFELVGEVLISLYSKEEQTAEEDEPQLEIVRSIADFLMFDRKNPIRKGLPNSLEELRPTFIDMILGLLPPRNDFIIARPTTANKLANTMCGKEGRDGHVENLLARELKLEEPDWVNYEKDSESVKNSVADAIFKSLLDDTAASVLLAHSRKINNRSQTFSM